MPLIRIPNYRRGWLLGMLTGVVRWLEFLALGIFAYQLTASPTLVALLAIVRVTPYVLLGFVVGALTDRYDRKMLFILSLSAMTVISAGMVVLTATGLASYPVILVATLATGIFWLTDMPIRRRLMTDSVSPDRVPRAMATDNITNYATRGLGPLGGGIVLQAFGVTGVFMLSFTLYLVCLVVAFRFDSAEPQPDGIQRAAPASGPDGDVTATRPEPSSRASGAATLLRNPRFIAILGVTVLYNLFCAPFIAMIPVFAQKNFGLSPATIGTLASLEGVGGVIGTIMIGIFIRPRTLFAAYFCGPLIYLSAILALSFALTPSYTFAALIAASFGGGCFSGTQYALVYTTAPPELRGRAFGFLALGIGSATLGLWNAGYLFEHYASATALRILAIEGLLPLAALGVYAFLARDRSAYRSQP